jgi:hypothetical protein
MAANTFQSAAADMSGETEPVYDEEATMEEALERCAVLPLRDVLKREYDENLKGRPRNVALEKWGPELEAEILRSLYKLND